MNIRFYFVIFILLFLFALFTELEAKHAVQKGREIENDDEGKKHEEAEEEEEEEEGRSNINEDTMDSCVGPFKLLNLLDSTWNDEPYDVGSTNWNDYFGFTKHSSYALCDDNVETPEAPKDYALPLHVPSKVFTQSGSVNILSKNLAKIRKRDFVNRLMSASINFVNLPLEPVQRLVTFAVEVSWLPSTWYIQLAFCVFYGVAPFTNGILTSYTLQDIIGVGLLMLNIVNNDWTEVKCAGAVEYFSDSTLIANTSDICNRVKVCLIERFFSNEEDKYYYHIFRDAFSRASSLYSAFKVNIKKMQITNYAFLLLRTTYQSQDFIDFRDKQDKCDKTYLPIRVMHFGLLLSHYLVKKQMEGRIPPPEHFVSIILKSFNCENPIKGIKDCISTVLSSSLKISGISPMVAHYVCGHIYKLGFVVDLPDIPSKFDINDLSQAIMPSLADNLNYASTVVALGTSFAKDEQSASLKRHSGSTHSSSRRRSASSRSSGKVSRRSKSSRSSSRKRSGSSRSSSRKRSGSSRSSRDVSRRSKSSRSSSRKRSGSSRSSSSRRSGSIRSSSRKRSGSSRSSKEVSRRSKSSRSSSRRRSASSRSSGEASRRSKSSRSSSRKRSGSSRSSSRKRSASSRSSSRKRSGSSRSSSRKRSGSSGEVSRRSKSSRSSSRRRSGSSRSSGSSSKIVAE